MLTEAVIRAAADVTDNTETFKVPQNKAVVEMVCLLTGLVPQQVELRIHRQWDANERANAKRS